MYPLYTETHCTNSRCPYFGICDQVPTKAFQSEWKERMDPMDILFISEYPTWKESSLRNFWVSSVGSVLTKFLAKEFPTKTYAISSAIRAWPYKPETLVKPQYNGMKASAIPEWVLSKAQTAPVHQHPYSSEIINFCRPFWERDVEQWKPKLIILVGSIALKSMFPYEQRSLVELTDVTLDYRGTPVRVVSSSHFILQKPSLKEAWTQKLKRAINNEKQAHFNNLDYGHWTENGAFIWNYKLLTTVDEVEAVVNKMIEERKPISLDTETENLRKKFGTGLGMIQIANEPDMIYAIPWVHYESPFDAGDLDRLREILKRLFLAPEIPYWMTWNCKFELNIIENTIGCGLSTKIYDGICAEFLLDENRMERVSEYKYGIYTLKQLSLDRLGFDGWNQDVLKSRGEGSLMDLPLEKIAEYGCIDVGLTLLLARHQIAEAERVEYENFSPLVFGLYDPIIRVFSQVERDGFPASREYVRSLIQKSSPILTTIRECLEALINSPEGQRANNIILERTTRSGAGRVNPLARVPNVFDPAKTGHPQVLFFEVMGLAPITTSDTGTASVDDEFQKAYKKSVPLVMKFSEWVEARKMFDSFAKALYDYLDPSGPHMDSKLDQRIRPNFRVSGVVTGRIACNEPNLQAIPRAETALKKAIKNVFQITEKGRIMVQLDFKANEMRWVGIAAKDQAMAKKFNDGKEALDRYRKTLDPEDLKLASLLGDIHKQNASSAFKIPIAQVTKDQRQAAKGISFGVLYDSSEASVADLYNLDLNETIGMFQGFYEAHHWIYAWKMEMKEMARQKGYVEAPHGRRRRFPIFDLFRNEHGWFDQNLVPKEHNGKINEALRQSSNAPIQGIASDAANIGANNLRMYIVKNKKDWKICNVVHDSCIVDIPIQDMYEYAEAAEKLFTTDVMDYFSSMWDVDFILPLEVDFDFGTKWGELKAWDFNPQTLKEIYEDLALRVA